MAWVGQWGPCMTVVMILIRSSRKSSTFGLGVRWWWSLLSMLDFLRCWGCCWVIGKRLEALRFVQPRRILIGFVRSSRWWRKDWHGWPGAASLAVLVGRIFNGSILELLNDWAYKIFVCSWRWRPVEYLHLPSFHHPRDRVHKSICISSCPEIYVQCMQPEQVFAFISGIGIR